MSAAALALDIPTPTRTRLTTPLHRAALPETGPAIASLPRVGAAGAINSRRLSLISSAPPVAPDEPLSPLPDTNPHHWVHGIARAIMEVLAGRRSCAILARWLTEDLYAALRTRADLHRRLPRTGTGRCIPIRTRSVHICVASRTPRHVALECVSVVDVDGFSRAMALRLESFRGRWLITALEIG